MLSSVTLAESPDFSVAAVRCPGRHAGWSAPEYVTRHHLVLVRSGRFRLRSNGHRAVADTTMGYLQVPGDEGSYAHPTGGDVCTAITFSPRLWEEVTNGGLPPAPPSVYVDGRLELAHRGLLRSAPDASFATAERLLDVVAGVVRQATGAAPAGPAGAGAGARGRALADAAREALLSDHPDAARLVSLARLLDVSPYHLSRVFRRQTGTTLTRYRNRVRIARALDRIEQGAGNLAEVAADLGFADQAHLARTARAELGHTPSELRRLLGRPEPVIRS